MNHKLDALFCVSILTRLNPGIFPPASLVAEIRYLTNSSPYNSTFLLILRDYQHSRVIISRLLSIISTTALPNSFIRMAFSPSIGQLCPLILGPTQMPDAPGGEHLHVPYISNINNNSRMYINKFMNENRIAGATMTTLPILAWRSLPSTRCAALRT